MFKTTWNFNPCSGMSPGTGLEYLSWPGPSCPHCPVFPWPQQYTLPASSTATHGVHLCNIYIHSYRKKEAFNLCIARRSGTASRAWQLLSINPLTGSCLVRTNILQYFLSKFRRARVCILFDCLQSLLDGSWKAEAKVMFPFVIFYI